ncbi:MAG: DUF2190 family protein [Sulfuricellaceae bacterium]|nr:DUF2190 family protein [Sulfuricellaceae bacterium]
MTQFSPLLTLPITLTGDVTANRFVTPAGVQAGADAVCIGVARSSGLTGGKIPVDVKGSAIVESGAAVAIGATLKSDASGKAIPWVTAGAKTAIALQAATAAGQMIEVLLLDNA